MSRSTRIAARIAGLALAASAPLILAAGSAQANYGDGINWYHFNITYTNEGNAASGPFRAATQPVWSTHGVFGNGDEVREEFDSLLLAPGQSVNRHYWVTEKVVDQRTWGIFLDINNQVPDSQKNDNFCSAWVNNT